MNDSEIIISALHNELSKYTEFKLRLLIDYTHDFYAIRLEKLDGKVIEPQLAFVLSNDVIRVFVRRFTSLRPIQEFQLYEPDLLNKLIVTLKANN